MEDPMTISVSDHFNMALDPDLSAFAYPNAYADYQGPDIFEQSYLSGQQLGYQIENRMDDGMINPLRDTLDLPKSSHDDLNQFFTDSPFSNATASPTPGQRYSALKTQGILGGYSPTPWERVIVNSTPDPWAAPQQSSPLAIVTAGLENIESRTVVHHGQVTPGDSPASPSKSPKPQRKTARKVKETAAAQRKSERASATKQTESAAPPVKKTRKPRKSSKKATTAEQEAQKRETFLKRNREAAYKCRIKKKTQTEMIMERAKTLDADNALKGLEVEQLRREVEGLKTMLLPHYRECGDEKLVRFVDGMVRGPVWGGSGAYECESAEDEAEGDTVFEMGDWEESMAMQGTETGSSVTGSLSSRRPSQVEMELQGGYMDQDEEETPPLLELDGTEV